MFVQRARRILPVVCRSKCGRDDASSGFAGKPSNGSLYYKHHFKRRGGRDSIECRARRSRCRMTVVIFQIVALIWNEKLDWNKGLGPTKNPARWGSTDGAVQSKSSARLWMRCWADYIHPKHDRKKTGQRH